MKIPPFVWLALFIVGGLAGAATADELYIGEAVVEPGRADARAPLLDALNQVLVRLTGRVGEDLVASLQLTETDAAALALGRQYRRDEVPQRAGRSRERRVLRVDFDPQSVDRLLEQAGLPSWGRDRPVFVLWIVSDGRDGADYLQSDPVLADAIERLSFRYGIELTRPILDASDRLEVTPADVRGGFTGAAEPATLRYGADGVIMLDLRRMQSFWTGRWAWRIGDVESAFERSGTDAEEALALGLGRITEALAARFAARQTGRNDQRLVVSGIASAAQYLEVARFLEALTGVDRVRVAGARTDTVTFDLGVSTDGLRQRIALTGPLEFVRHDLADDTLHYRFVL